MPNGMMTDAQVSVGDAEKCSKATELQVCVSRLMMPAVYKDYEIFAPSGLALDQERGLQASACG